MRIIKTFFTLLILMIDSSLASASDIEGVRLYRSPDRTRIVLDLNDSIDHKMFVLESPARVVVDLADADLKTNFDSLKLDVTPIGRIRTGKRNKNQLRLVFDLKEEVNPKSFTLAANERYGNRLVIDLYDFRVSVSKSLSDIIKTDNRSIVIAIDAGHGGEDPGALGPGKILEKHIVLKIAQYLKKLFDEDPDFSGLLVREGDYYLALRKRTAIAQRYRADFFLSIHADAWTSPSARGASVYALSTKGATSETAKFLANRENRADLIGGAGSINIKDKSADVAAVLLDLSMTATLGSSLTAGEYILKNIGSLTRLHKKRVEQAGFLVLKSTDIPSLLIEAGYISNPDEARKLSTSAFQKKMALAIYSGVVQYYLDHPPPGTALSKNLSKRQLIYIVERGDTLSEIAASYKVSVSRLTSHNKLTSQQIRVGQKLMIPTK
jgi:N-acetylmuramoyl-L-alanine amidase